MKSYTTWASLVPFNAAPVRQSDHIYMAVNIQFVEKAALLLLLFLAVSNCSFKLELEHRCVAQDTKGLQSSLRVRPSVRARTPAWESIGTKAAH